jgi:hypothetical protein
MVYRFNEEIVFTIFVVTKGVAKQAHKLCGIVFPCFVRCQTTPLVGMLAMVLWTLLWT